MQETQIDFTKPLEVIDMQGKLVDHCNVVHVIPWSYVNDYYQCAVVITAGTAIALHHTSVEGTFSDDSPFFKKFKLRNKKEVIREVWVNLYKDGGIGDSVSSRHNADRFQRPGKDNRYAYFVTKEFSDGSVTNEIILIKE